MWTVELCRRHHVTERVQKSNEFGRRTKIAAERVDWTRDTWRHQSGPRRRKIKGAHVHGRLNALTQNSRGIRTPEVRPQSHAPPDGWIGVSAPEGTERIFALGAAFRCLMRAALSVQLKHFAWELRLASIKRRLISPPPFQLLQRHAAADVRCPSRRSILAGQCSILG